MLQRSRRLSSTRHHPSNTLTRAHTHTHPTQTDDRTVARLLLRPTDAAWPVPGYAFEADAAPPGEPEYVVLRSRFDAAMAHQWAPGARAQLFMAERDPLAPPDAAPEGRWWPAEVVADNAAAAGAAAGGGDDDPYGRAGQWERFTIRWILDAGDGGAGAGAGAAGDAGGSAAPDLTQAVSPWELFPAGATTAAALAEEPPRLDAAAAGRVLAAAREAARRSVFRVFAETPPPDAAWVVGGAPAPYNRAVALPLGLDVLMARLRPQGGGGHGGGHGGGGASGGGAGLRYYRSLEGALADARLIAANAAAYNGARSAVAADARALVAALERAAGGDDPRTAVREEARAREAAEAAAAEAAEDEEEEEQHDGGGNGGGAPGGSGPSAAAVAAAAAAAGLPGIPGIPGLPALDGVALTPLDPSLFAAASALAASSGIELPPLPAIGGLVGGLPLLPLPEGAGAALPPQVPPAAAAAAADATPAAAEPQQGEPPPE